MKIGELARRSGLSIHAIRFYEQRGVLPAAERTSSGYRRFDDAALDRLELVGRLQGLGLTLAEVVEALAGHDRPGASCDSERWRLERVRSRIEARIAELEGTRKAIDDALRDCERGCCALRARVQTGSRGSVN